MTCQGPNPNPFVTFDYAKWIARYPEFADPGGSQPVSQATAQEYFNEATLYLNNDGQGPVRNATYQLMYLNMLTAHIAALNAPPATGGAASTLVGRISSATEGSVSVSTENSYASGTVQWYQQTKYGSAFWAAMLPYRQWRYNPGPVMGVPANQFGGPFGAYPYNRGRGRFG